MNRQSGFTLVELLLVIVLLGLVTGFATLYFASSFSRSKVSATARDIAGSIRYARAMAAERQEEELFLLDLDSKSFGMEGKTPKALPPGIVMAIYDPLLGDISRGRYHLHLLPTGGVTGGSILLSGDRRSFRISPDPVVGVKVVKE